MANASIIVPRAYPVLLIGECGQKASGKDLGCERLAAQHGFRALGFGDAVRRAAREEYHLENATTADLIRIGNERREQSGDCGYWAGRLLDIIEEERVEFAVVQGIRNPGEVLKFQGLLGPRFTLLAVTAPLALRANRLIARARSGDPTTFEEFMKLDDADRGIGQREDGQRTDDCVALTPFANRFVNDGSVEAYHAWLDAKVAEAKARLGL